MERIALCLTVGLVLSLAGNLVLYKKYRKAWSDARFLAWFLVKERKTLLGIKAHTATVALLACRKRMLMAVTHVDGLKYFPKETWESPNR